MSFRLWKSTFPLNRKGLWNVEWNREGEPVHLWTMVEDELDELRRVLGVGMGDCDHCPAWLPYMESLKHQVHGEVISHDMTRLEIILTANAERLNDAEKHFDRHDALLDLNSKEIVKINSHLNVTVGAFGKRIGTLETKVENFRERATALESDDRLENLESEQDILSQHMVEIDNLIDELKREVDLMAFIEAYARGRRLLAQDRKDETDKSGSGGNQTA
jgi:hypothetical protein